MSKIVSTRAAVATSRSSPHTPGLMSYLKRFEDIEEKLGRLEDEMINCTGAMQEYKSKAAQSTRWLIELGTQVGRMEEQQEIVEKGIAKLQERQRLVEERLKKDLQDLSTQVEASSAHLDSALGLRMLLENRVQECERDISKEKDTQANFMALNQPSELEADPSVLKKEQAQGTWNNAPSEIKHESFGHVTSEEMDTTNDFDMCIWDAASLDTALDLHMKPLTAKRELLENRVPELELDATKEKNMRANFPALQQLSEFKEDLSVLKKAHAQETWNRPPSDINHDSSRYVTPDEMGMTSDFDGRRCPCSSPRSE